MKKIQYIGLFLALLLLIVYMPRSVAADTSRHVIYQVQWLTDHSGKVSLTWSDGSTDSNIQIAGWKPSESGIIVLYRTGTDVAEGYDSLKINFDAVAPVAIYLQESSQTSQESLFEDLGDDTEANLAIQLLYDRGIISGYTDGTFKPENSVTRAEFSKMLFMVSEMDTGENMENPFTDVAEDYWAKDYILTLAEQGIVNGKSEGIFDPSGTVTYGELLAMIDRCFIFDASEADYPYSLTDHWSNSYFTDLVKAGIVQTSDDIYTEYTPNQKATRQDCALFLSRVLTRYHGLQS